MTNQKRNLINLPDGRLAITQANCDDTDLVSERAILLKTLFELSRPWLSPPAPMTPPETDYWRMNVHFEDYDGPIPAVLKGQCLHADLPSDRYFRNAWECQQSTVICNMEKARAIHMDAIRQVRNIELVKLDILYLRVVEMGNQPEQKRLATLKQTLRDIPQTFDLSIFTTPEELKAAWPSQLPPRREASS